MSDMTIDRAVEVLDRERHHGRGDWRRFDEVIFVPSVGEQPFEFLPDAIIVAKWYESQRPKPLVPEESYYRDYDPEPDESQRQPEVIYIRTPFLRQADCNCHNYVKGSIAWTCPHHGPQRPEWHTAQADFVDLEAIEMRLAKYDHWPACNDDRHVIEADFRDIPALIALVRRLQDEHGRELDRHDKRETDLELLLTAATSGQPAGLEQELRSQIAALTAERDALQKERGELANRVGQLLASGSNDNEMELIRRAAKALQDNPSPAVRVAQLEQEIDALQGQIAQGWQDIESAPKDGTRILGFPYWSDGLAAEVRWKSLNRTPGRWETAGGLWSPQQPTLWRSLPAPPADLVKEKER